MIGNNNPVKTYPRNIMKNFNIKIALFFTKKFGSMITFYLFCLWALLPFLPGFSSYKDLILYISAGFIQLVALPLISVGSNIIGEVTEKRDQQQFDAVMQELQLAKDTRESQVALMQEIRDMHLELHKLLEAKD